MLLLHISDIHFKEPACLDAETDPDRSIRTRVVRHLRQKLDEMGTVDAILVGGDIAYKAHPDEYKTANQWLTELAKLCGCSPEHRIFVVPGNHDVDRGTTGRDVGVQNVQHRIATASEAEREDVLRAQLQHDPSGSDLFAAHKAYNDFAAPMNCQIYPKKIFWHQDIELGGGVMLRIYGLTSTLLSGRHGKDDNPRDLYLSPLQTALDPVEDRVNMVMCHHPVDWFIDQDAADDAISARATIHIFGHKHRQRIIPGAEYVRIFAGAVNPSRKEPNYEPGYNLIKIDVEGSGADRRLEIETHQFRYQPNPEGFVPVKTANGKDYFRSTIAFPGRQQKDGANNRILPVAAEHKAAVDIAEEPKPAVVGDVEASMGEERYRDLIYRFWKLDGDKKRQIALGLGLITEAELSLPEPERYGTAFLRAGERGQLDEVAKMIASMEG